MKTKILLIVLSCMLLGGVVKGQYVNIPDSNFRRVLMVQYPTSFNSAGMLDTSSADIIVSQMLVIDTQNITDLDGFQYFKNLKEFLCFTNNITSLPAMPNTLRTLLCFNNPLTSLPILPNSLKELDCNNNQLSSLPNLPNSLEYLECNGNQLKSLPILPNSLTYLNCSNNLLTNVPALPNSLKELDCNNNQLPSLPNLPNSLRHLECDNNQLISLPILPNSLNGLNCSNNGLTGLPALPNSLKELYCNHNQLSSLPNLPNSLQHLECDNNQLKSLPILPNFLNGLNCSNNELNSLPALPNALTGLRCFNNQNLACLGKLPDSLSDLSFDTALVHCIPNFPSNCLIYDTTHTNSISYYPLCNPVNNSNQCQSFPIINGKIFNDNNNNGIKDSNDFYRKNIKVLLSNGNYVYTNDSGYFQIATDSIGAYTLTIQAPNFYTAIPSRINYNFIRYDTLVTDTIALQANTIKDSLSVRINSYNWRATPGFSFPYIISYENVGTTILNPAINFNYDSSRLVYDSSNAIVNNTGNSITLNTSGYVPGQIGSFVAYFTVKTNAVLGDSIKANAIITGGIATATDNVYSIISGSYDPNDKEATLELTTAQVANGSDIDYTIRFQNTGTDTAFHVVIADTLTSLLQANTLEMIASSHNCKTTVKDGIAYFEMRDILLPDSNINEIKSHGFVRFKVKPISTLVNGDSVNNKASIYFDYNSPVRTNVAITKIKKPVVVPLKLLSFDGNALENGNNELYWNTENEINTESFVIQRSVDGRVFTSIGEVVANGKGSYQFTDNRVPLTAFYRLMIRDNDGSFSFSKIIVIKSKNQDPKFEILSNPVKDKLVLSNISNSLMNTEASLINSAGVVVKRFVIHASTETINVRGLEAGMYYLRTVEGSRKVVVSR